jgi:hypothetical protein
LGGSFINASGALRREGEVVSGFFVIASQRVGAKRRPMTGSTKQSIFLLPHHGLLRRFAPRNDGF